MSHHDPLSDPHGIDRPSAWVMRHAPGIPAGGEVLDLACGSGRHVRYLAALGLRVLAVDIDLSNLGPAAALPGVTALQADLEGSAWPLARRTFAAVVVTNYLHRPLLPCLVDAIAPRGLLIYETFAAGNERFGKPSNPRFLLQPGELLEAVRGRLRVLAYEDLIVNAPRRAAVQRICAARSHGSESGAA